MAKSIIVDIKPGFTPSIKNSNFSTSTISNISYSVKASSIDIPTKISGKDYSIAKVTDGKHEAKVMSVLPFRVRFTAVGIPGYGPHNPAPIGIAIIGYSNYIL